MRTIYLFTDDAKRAEYPVQDRPEDGELIRIKIDDKDCGVYVPARVTVMESCFNRDTLCDLYHISGGCGNCDSCNINTYGIECLPGGKIDDHFLKSAFLCPIGRVLKSVDNIMENL